MNSAERVDRVMEAVTHTVYESDPELNITRPLIEPGEEYWFTSQAQVRAFVRRILAAADGVAEFTDVVKPYDHTTVKRVRHGKKPNLEGRQAYEAHKRERRQA